MRKTKRGLWTAVALGVLVVVAGGVGLSVAPAADQVPSAATAIKPRPGRYIGKTEQGLPVHFRVINGKVRGPRYKIEGGRCLFTFKIYGGDKISTLGWFKLATLLQGSFKGQFVTRRSVQGKARGVFGIHQGCPYDETVSYKAHHR